MDNIDLDVRGTGMRKKNKTTAEMPRGPNYHMFMPRGPYWYRIFSTLVDDYFKGIN